MFYKYWSNDENYIEFIILLLSDRSHLKQGAKLQQARLIGASDDVNKRRGALAPPGVGGGF